MSDRLFHKPGLVYFWFLNDECREEKIDRFVEAFADAGVAAVCLHPRPGLLLPYGGDDFFEFIGHTVEKCVQRGLEVWLYDEDPYPSGSCGGWITAERPEYLARAIERFAPEEQDVQKDLFCFPTGRLLWCGLLREADGQTIELTERVGIVRREWKLLDPCDSSWYYPNTPLYSCPRSGAVNPEFALRLGEMPEGYSPVAFVARPVVGEGYSPWGQLADPLNPRATEESINRTHERYRQAVGDKFGREVRAIFTDEPKYFGGHPWTPGMFEGFEEQFGYDLRGRLWQLFADSTDEQCILTRLHYRQWCGERFERVWLEPVGRWCRENKLALVGHISPEDDPLQQADCVTNLFPLFKHFAIPGIDLIIPAVGDHEHPIINIGPISAVSAAQQQDKPGVLSETLGASGLDLTVTQAKKILQWQLMMGVSTHVVHGAFNSVEDMRLYDAPPDFGPDSSRWEGMQQLAGQLAEFQPVVRDSRQVAPVAVVWPIRSFSAMGGTGYSHECPLRDELLELIRLCLDRQVGVQLADEANLWQNKPQDGELRIGKARYSHLVVPSSLVLHERTVGALRVAAENGLEVLVAGSPPKWQQTEKSLEQMNWDVCPVREAGQVVQRLPRLVEIAPDGLDIRCTAWEKEGRRTYLMLSLRKESCTLSVNGRDMTFAPNELYATEQPGR